MKSIFIQAVPQTYLPKANGTKSGQQMAPPAHTTRDRNVYLNVKVSPYTQSLDSNWDQKTTGFKISLRFSKVSKKFHVKTSTITVHSMRPLGQTINWESFEKEYTKIEKKYQKLSLCRKHNLKKLTKATTTRIGLYVGA